MSAQAILKEAVGLGVDLRLNGDGVQFKGKPSPDLLAKLRAHKAEVIALLREATRPPSSDMAAKKAAIAPPEHRRARIAAPEPFCGNSAQAVCDHPKYDLAAALAHAAAEVEFQRQLAELRAHNAKVYANPTPWPVK